MKRIEICHRCGIYNLELKTCDGGLFINPETNKVSTTPKEGYVKGYPDGSFHPKDPVTREQLQIELWRIAGKPEV